MSEGALFLDIETRSCRDVTKTGAEVYARDLTTEVQVARFGLRDGFPVLEWRPGQPPPTLWNEHVAAGRKVVAHNVGFEASHLGQILGPRHGWAVPALEQWDDTAAMAAAMALPRKLEDVGLALRLPVQKDKDGHALMKRVSRPRKLEGPKDAQEAIKEGRAVRRLWASGDREGYETPDGEVIVTWWTDPERIDRLSQYCATDVEVTRLVYPKLRPLTPTERAVWLLDQKINDRGVFVDLAGVRAAQSVVDGVSAALTRELATLTLGAVRTAKQVAALRGWLAANGADLPDLARGTVEKALKDPTVPQHARRALEIRLTLSKSSTSKLEAFARRRCPDGRARGNLVYHAATTGRWAGVGIQMQNLPRGELPKGVKAEDCLPMVLTGDYRAVQMVWGDPMGVVSACLRSFITAAPGNELTVADYSNIEGRVLAWLAGEAWKIQAFRDFDAGTGADLYALAYAKSFGVTPQAVMDNKKNGDGSWRQIGKVQELALGYQGGVGAFQSMAANYRLEVSDARADEIKTAWREANPAIVRHWYELENAALAAVASPGTIQTVGKVAYSAANGFLWCRLPSGRLLAYPNPRLKTKKTKWGSEKTAICFDGVDQKTRQWGEQSTYGGKLAENNTQAVARDLMAEAMLRVEAAGYPVVLSVHDEPISEHPKGFGTVEDFEKTVATLPAWAAGIPVAAEGWRGVRYGKG